VARHAPVSVLFKPSYDRRFTKMIENFRMVNGIKGICVADPWHLRAVRRALARNEVVGILLDQATSMGIRISFLGQPASTSPIVAKLARRTHAPLLVGTIHRKGPCQHAISIHRLELEKIHYDLQKSTEMMSQALENAILRDPAQWVWSLDRWRSTGIELMSSVQRSI
jgi:Kdo2-lipid IVA lauroyltransferase/acyltransferase